MTNDERADRAEAVAARYSGAPGEPFHQEAGDLICDLCHAIERDGAHSPQEVLERAFAGYLAEREDESGMGAAFAVSIFSARRR